jgi:hypothetical protein
VSANAYKTDAGDWVVADGCWLPGAYDSKTTALHAAAFSYERLSELNKRVCHIDGENRALTMDDLQE